MMTTSRRLVVLLVAWAGAAWAQPVVTMWSAETVRVPTFTAGDLALVVDVGPDAGAPIIIGTDPRTSGVYTYDLTGKQLQNLLPGVVSGVDSRSRLNLAEGRTLAAISSFTNMNLPVVRVAVDGGLEVLSQTLFNGAGAIALTRTPNGGLEAWVETHDARAHHLVYDGGAFLDLDTITLTAAPSAMVVDDRWRRLFLATPMEGIYTLEPDGGFGLIIDLAVDFASTPISGIALYPLNDGGTLLLTTIPSTSVVAVHNVSTLTAPVLIGSFAVGPPDGGAARVGLSTALDLTSRALPAFDGGLVVLHDGNTANYKLIAWRDIANAFTPPLPIELPIDDAGPPPDAGRVDGGADGGRDAGADGGADAGRDAGVRDAGVRDGGTGGGGGSRGGGAGSTGGGAGGGGDEEPTGCTCASVEPLLPLLLGVWLWRRRRV